MTADSESSRLHAFCHRHRALRAGVERARHRRRAPARAERGPHAVAPAPAVPPARSRHAAARHAAGRGAMVALLEGEARDLRFCTLDLRRTAPFHRRVYAAAQDILPGKTQTYGEIATLLGEPGSARAVGQALGHNPFPIIVPCHRVLASGAQSGRLLGAGRCLDQAAHAADRRRRDRRRARPVRPRTAALHALIFSPQTHSHHALLRRIAIHPPVLGPPQHVRRQGADRGHRKRHRL
jgi:O-6-methylguanine DNA methyltransferase